MGPDLKELKDILNNRLFCCDLLEFRSGDNEMDRLKVKDSCNNKSFMDEHHFCDLFLVGTNNALFTDRAKDLINELAVEAGIEIKFIYSQCIISK